MSLGPLGLIDLDNPPPSLAKHVIELGETYWRVPSGLHAGEPLTFTDEQIEWLWAWWEVTPDGRRLVRNRAHLEGPKGWSKSPLGGVCAFADFIGEVVPDGLNAYGEPVGRPHPNPEVQILGVAKSGTDNLYLQMFDALTDSPALATFGIDMGLTRMNLTGRPGSLEPMTTALSRTGNPVSSIYREEPWLWTSTNGGKVLASTVNQNARKMRARVLDLTNTPVPGSDCVANDTIAKHKERPSPRTLMVRIRSKIEVPDIKDDEVARAALVSAYGSHCTDNGGWIDVDEYLEDRPPGDTTEAQWRRLYLGEDDAEDDEGVIIVSEFRTLARPRAVLRPGDTVCLGFDGADVSDAAALYAVRWPDWCIFELGVWEPPPDPITGAKAKRGTWKVPRREVTDRMRWALETFNVARGYADPAYWQTEIDGFSEEFGEAMMRFPHHSATRIGPACERWDSMASVEGDGPTLSYSPVGADGDELALIRHAMNARKDKCGPKTAAWWRPVRRVQGHPIDAFSAAVGAVHAMGDALAAGTLATETFEDFVEVV